MSDTLKKDLNLFMLTIFGIGIIIGAGIYAVLGAAAGHASSSLWLSFLLAAIIAALTALSYCELAAMFPSAGAEFIYLRKVFPDKKLPAFLLGFILTLAGAATVATVAYGFAGYLQNIIEIPKSLSAFSLIAIVTIINSFGIKNSSWVNLLFTGIEVIGLLVVIWFGFTTEPIKIPEFKFSAGTISATTLIFFVYLGFEEIANLAEETKDPEKNIPKAFMLSLGITTLLYIAVAIAVLNLTTPEILSRSDLPLAEALKHIAPRWVIVLTYIALCSTFNTALITMLGISRMVFGIANEGELPKILKRTIGKNKIPLPAGIFAFFSASIFLLLGELEILASVSSFLALLGFFTVNVLLIVLRYKKPDLKRPFKTPLSIGKMPLIPLLGLLFILALCTRFSLQVYLITVAMLAAGVIIFFITKKMKTL